MSYSYSSRNPLARTSPLRSMPASRTAGSFFGPSRAVVAQAELQNAAAALAGELAAYAGERAALGMANRRPMTMRRWWQGQALRTLSQRRVMVRAAQRRVDAAQAVVDALTLADDGLAFGRGNAALVAKLDAARFAAAPAAWQAATLAAAAAASAATA